MPECAPDAGRVVPRIDRNRCEAKADCVRVCPYDVFGVRRLTTEERAPLSFVGRMKLLVHGGRQAFAVRADACHACGLCVKACSERAIRLVAVGDA
jgi:4Fe-4S ferredoxin